MLNLSRHKIGQVNIASKETKFDYIQTLSFVGLGASGSYILEDSYKEGVISTPKVTVIDSSPQTIYFDFNIDYTHTIDSSSAAGRLAAAKELLRVISIKNNADLFFSNFIEGNTFDVTTSEYNFNQYDLNGHYTFLSSKDNLVVSTCTAGLTNAPEQIYNPVSFDDVPVFTASSPKTIYTDKNKMILTNSIPSISNSFVSSGVTVNTILEISDIKYRVEEINIKAGTEEILLSILDESETITVPSLNMTSVNLINVYRDI